MAQVGAVDEDALGVARGENPAAIRGAGLIQYRGSLRGRLPQRQRVKTVLLALVPDRPDPARLGVDATGTVSHDRVVAPAALPQRIHDPHVFLGEIVTIIVRHLLAQPHRPRGAVELAGHDVPADPPARPSDGPLSPSAARTDTAVHRRGCRSRRTPDATWHAPSPAPEPPARATGSARW